MAHEAFLSAWPPLAEAITGSGTALRTRRVVEQAATEWDTGGRPHARLWERGQLAAAVRDLGAHTAPAHPPTAQSATDAESAAATAAPTTAEPSPSPPRRSGSRRPRWLHRRRMLVTARVDLSPRARAFLHTSLRVDRRRRARATTILSVLLTLALTAAGVAVIQGSEAREQQRLATSRQLITQAEAARNSDIRAAMRLGVAAQHLHPDSQTRASLMNTLISTRAAGTLTGHTDAVAAVAFAPDGRTLATASWDNTVILWDLSDPGAPTGIGEPLTGHTGSVNAVAFAPDGRTLATASDDTVILWDLSDPGALTRIGEPLTIDGASAVALAPDGRTLATAGFDGTVRPWDLSDPGAPTRIGAPLTGHTSAVNDVAFAPDGRTLATASSDSTVILWDLSDPGSPIRRGEPLTGHAHAVAAVAFAPDGRTLATASQDRTVILWDLSDPGSPTRLGEPLTGAVNDVAFAPDGRTLATAGDDRMVILWDLTDLSVVRDHPAEQACRVTERALDRAEWARFIPGLPYEDTCPARRTAVRK